ncbi:MAG: FkbM family methyltransferase [Bacteroidota bacterium]
MTSLRTFLARAKRKLLQKPFIKDKRYPAYWFDQLLGDRDAYLVQIGSNDGKTGDPLYPLLQKHSNWRGLFVEPVPYSFEKLKANYPDPNRFRFENVAINEGQSLTFYWVDSKAKEALPDLPYWFDQLGSFDKNHILKHFDGALAPFMRSAELEGLSLPQLLSRNEVAHIEVLHIDTEGYDWKILSQLDQERYTPQFILYEYNHLSEAERKASFDFLKEKYVLFNLGIDILALNRSFGEEVVGQMKRYMKLV